MSYVKLCALGLVGAMGVLGASSAKAMTLADLLGAGPVTVGGFTYSNFTYGSTPGGPAMMPANWINVNFTSNGVQFTAGWNTAFNPIMDSAIGYDLSVVPSAVTKVSLSMAGLVSVSGGTASVGETVSDGTTKAVLGNLAVHYSGEANPVLSNSLTLDNTHQTLHLLKDITVSNVQANGGSYASVSFVDNTFQTGPFTGVTPPIPEPMSLALLPLALGGLALRKKLAR